MSDTNGTNGQENGQRNKGIYGRHVKAMGERTVDHFNTLVKRLAVVPETAALVSQVQAAQAAFDPVVKALASVGDDVSFILPRKKQPTQSREFSPGEVAQLDTAVRAQYADEFPNVDVSGTFEVVKTVGAKLTKKVILRAGNGQTVPARPSHVVLAA